MNRRVLRIASRAVLGIAVLAILLLAVVTAVFDDDDYRDALIDLVESRSDYRLAIAGPFSLAPSLTPSLNAVDVTLSTGSGAVLLRAGEVSLGIELFSLLSGSPTLSRLGISDVEIDAGTLAAWSESTADSGPGTLSAALPPVPRIELRNVRLRPTPGAAIARLDIGSATVEASGPNAPIRLRGDAGVDGFAFRLIAELGPLAELLEPSRPYPLSLALHAGDATLEVTGTLAEPLQGSGITGQLEGHAKELATLLAHAGLELPALGSGRVTGRIDGDLQRLLLHDLRTTVAGREGFELTAGSTTVQLVPFGTAELAVTGRLDNAELRDRLLPGFLAPAKAWQLDGTLTLGEGGIGFRETTATGSDGDAFSVTLKGGGQFAAGAGPAWPPAAFDVALALRSRESQTVRALLPDFLPELGPLTASGRLAVVDGALALQDLDAEAGPGSDLEVRATGSIARLPASAEAPIAGIDLALDVAATRTERLGYLFGAQLPEVGPVRIAGRYRGGADGAQLENLQLHAGDEERVSLGATGSLRFGAFADGSPAHDLAIETVIEAPSLAPLADIMQTELPEHGPLRARFTVAGAARKPRLDAVDATLGPDDGPRLNARGTVGHVVLEPVPSLSALQLELHGSAPSTSALSPWLDVELPDAGAVALTAKLVDGDGRLGLETAELRVGPSDRPRLVATGTVGDLATLSQVAIDVHLQLDTDETLERLVGRDLGELGELRGEFEISDADGSLGIEGLELSSSGTDLLSLKVSGLLDDFKARDQIDLHADFRARDTAVVGMLLGKTWPAGSPVHAQGKLSGDLGRGRFDGTVEAGRTRIALQVDGDLTGVRPRFSGSIGTDTLHLEDFGLVPRIDTENPPPASENPRSHIEDADSDGGASSRAVSSARRQLFGTEPLPFDLLKGFDLEVDLTAAKIIGSATSIESLTALINLEEGRLAINPAIFIYEEGKLTMDVSVDANDMPRLGLKLHGDDVALGGLLMYATGSQAVRGTLTLHVDLSSSGRTQAELASGLGGVVELAVEDMLVPTRTLNLMASNLLDWAVIGTLQPNAVSRLDCGILMAKFDKGRMDFDTFYIDGETMTIVGEGHINFADETLDMALLPNKKKRLFFSGATPVRLTGALRDPTVSKLPDSAVAAIYAGLSLAPQVLLPVKAAGYLVDLLSDGQKESRSSECLEDLRAAQ